MNGYSETDDGKEERPRRGWSEERTKVIVRVRWIRACWKNDGGCGSGLENLGWPTVSTGPQENEGCVCMVFASYGVRLICSMTRPNP